MEKKKLNKNPEAYSSKATIPLFFLLPMIL
jgi:hypothetical protein